MPRNTKDAVGHDCAVPVRMAVEEGHAADGLTRAEVEDIIGQLGELPDLWDFCLGSWAADSATARFVPEGFQDAHVRGLKRLTSKPVVGVGRFTSPEAMVAQIREGVMDMIGAARPSIADPFLPRKIEEGRAEDLRECIGCNICVASDNQSVPIRCTQNPTMGEEWRRGWHPERIAPKASAARVLVVGAGPAGLEAAHQLGRRGYAVALAEASGTLGGRAVAEAGLPGLATWKRVADYRVGQIDRLDHVEVFRGGALTAQDVLDFGAAHVALATGAGWARDGWGRSHLRGIEIAPGATVLTPDDIFAGARPSGAVAVYDDDHYAVGSAIAELLAQGAAVTLVTPAALVATWTRNTMEQPAIEARLLKAGVGILARHAAARIEPGALHLTCGLTGAPRVLEAQTVVLACGRIPRDGLLRDLAARREDWAGAGIATVTAIGDALAPGMLVHAVHDGHRYARELEATPDPDAVPFRRDLPR